jgi:hypothetical protein
MTIMINPGTGPVEGATVERARSNMDAFTADLRAAGIHAGDLQRRPEQDDAGRFAYQLTMDDTRQVTVEMPGLPLDRVRFTGAAGQDIWQFPRLYVDGSSWLWEYAVAACRPPEGFEDPRPAWQRPGALQPYEVDPADAEDDEDPTAGECTNPACGCRP